MDILFTKSSSPFLLHFHKSNMEELFSTYIQQNSISTYRRVNLIIFLIQIAISFGGLIYEFIVSIPGDSRFKFKYELISLIANLVALIIEAILFFTNIIPRFKGCFLILAFLIQMTETSMPTLSEYGISLGGLTLIVFSIFVGIFYNKYFILPSISFIIGICYFFGRIVSEYPQVSLYQLGGCIFTLMSVGFWGGNLFYNNELNLRKDFFNITMIKGKRKILKNVLQEIPISVLYRKNKKLEFLNNTLKEMLGISQLEDQDAKLLSKTARNEIYYLYLSKIRREDDDKMLSDCLENDRNITRNISSSNFYYTLNNVRLQLKIKGVKIRDIDSIIEILVIEDISQMLKIQTETANKYQQILIASVSHEILTPTNGSIGLLETAIELSNSPKIVKRLKYVQKACIKLIFFVNLLKDYSLVENGFNQINNSNFNIVKCIDECYDLFDRDIRKKALEFKARFQSPVMLVNSDKYKITQILFTLISNAIKHTFSGSITVCLRYNEDGSTFELTIEDTGIGIKPEDLGNIFKVFFNSKQRNDLNPQGIGIQLFVCRKMIEIMSGTITVTSEFGKWTKFNIILPCNVEAINQNEVNFIESFSSNRPVIPEQNFHKLSSLNAIPSGSSFSKNRKRRQCKCRQFLIVDDDPTNVKVLHSYFKSMNLEADSAFNGQIAVDKVLKNNSNSCCNGYELILMDLNMPVMDGEEATRIIKNKIKSGLISPCKIVAVTAAQIYQEEQREKFINAGFLDIYSKPISKKDFESIIFKYSEK